MKTNDLIFAGLSKRSTAAASPDVSQGQQKPGLKLLKMILLLMVFFGTVHAQIIQTWNFNTNPYLGGWGLSSPAPLGYNVAYNPTPWIDMTGSGWGNGYWMQTNGSPTVPGKIYRIDLDLATFYQPAWIQYDAGVNVYADGNPVNVGTNRLHHANFTNNVNLPLGWQAMSSNQFVATGCSALIKIEGNAERINPNDPVGSGPGVIGIDNVKLVEVGEAYDIVVSQGENCNEYCFNIGVPPGLNAPTTVAWYVDNVYESTGLTFCRRFPKNQMKEVKAVFTINTPCGSFNKTIKEYVTATADCPCDLQEHVSLTAERVTCDGFHMNLQFDPGYSSLCTQWSIDGQLGGDLSTEDPVFSPGQHTICVFLMGGLTGDGDNICCAKLCVTINIPVATVENRVISYCPITYPLGPWYNPCNDCNGYYEFYKNNVLVGTSANGCISYVLDAPAEMRCYDVVNGQNCLTKTIYLSTQAQPINGMYAPDETVSICGDENSTYPYTINCGPGYPNYELYGPNNFYTQGPANFPVVINLAPGTYTLDCVNYATCSMVRKIVNVVQSQMQVTQCGVFVEYCYQLAESGQWSFLNLMNCPECRDVIDNATSSSPWTHLNYSTTNFNGYRVVQKEYVDLVNCRKCVVTVTVANANADQAETTISTNGQPCITITSDMLAECLRDKQLKAFSLGSPWSTVDIGPGASFQLCCNLNNGQGGTYYIHSVDDPCCYMVIHLDCSIPLPPEVPRMNGNSSQGNNEGPNQQEAQYRLVPNPTSSLFRVESLRGETSYQSVEIRDVNGEVLLRKQNVDSQTYFNVARFAKGTYFVIVTTSSGSASLKLVTMSE